MRKENFISLTRSIPHGTLNRILYDYDEGVPVPEIILRYNLGLTPSELAKALPPKKTPYLCPYCHVNMVIARTRKNAKKPLSPDSSIWCPKCYHYLHAKCKCSNCADKRLRETRFLTQKRPLEIEVRRKRITRYWDLSVPDELIETDELIALHQIFVGVILTGSSFDTANNEISGISRELCPTLKGTEQLIIELLRYRILSLSDSSPVEAFSESGAELIDPTLAHYRLNLVESSDLSFDDLKNGRIYISDRERISVLFELGVQELVQILLYQMNKIKILRSFVPGRKTLFVLRKLLRHYSVNQGIYLIYLGVVHTNNLLYAKEPLDRKRAQSHVIQEIETRLKKACENHTQVKSYRWPDEVKRSVFSHFIHTLLSPKGSVDQ